MKFAFMCIAALIASASALPFGRSCLREIEYNDLMDAYWHYKDVPICANRELTVRFDPNEEYINYNFADHVSSLAPLKKLTLVYEGDRKDFFASVRGRIYNPDGTDMKVVYKTKPNK